MRHVAWFSICTLFVTACGGDDGGTYADARDPSGVDATARPDGGGVDTPDASPLPIDAAPPASDPGDPGAFQVVTNNTNTTTSIGSTQLTVYSPSTDGTTPAAGPFPLVLFSTGFQIGRDKYDLSAKHLASWGYVVVTHDFTNGNQDEKAAEVSELIDWALGTSSGIAARIDATKIATVGHSLGGKVSIRAAIDDPRIDTVVGWDPVDALPPFTNDGSTSVAPERMAGFTKPILVLGETTDAVGDFQACAPAGDNYIEYYDAACDASAAMAITFAGGDHTDWVDSRSSCGIACLFCKTGTADDATVLGISRSATVAWLQIHLRGETSYATYLAPPALGAPASVESNPGC